jgi:predicted phage terminase large subunit-like protein
MRNLRRPLPTSAHRRLTDMPSDSSRKGLPGSLENLSIESVRAEKARRTLREFIRTAWPVIEPGTEFCPGFHIDAISDHLEAVTRGEIRNLLITLPPRHAKSLTVSIFWPAWVWITYPEKRWLFASYGANLSIRDSVSCRRLIQSPWYQRHWASRFLLTSDQNSKVRFENDRTGFRLATSVGGSITGEGGDVVVVDDAHNIAEVHSDTIRQSTLDWYDSTLSTRLNDPKTGARVIIMQRVHQQDLAGHVLEQGGYEHLCLPAEFEPWNRCVTSIGWRDPRTEQGELLWPKRFGKPEIDNLKVTLGSYGAAAQLQQRPAPAGGGIVKDHWWRYWRPRGVTLSPVPVRMQDGSIAHIEAIELPEKFDQQIQSWDMAFKDLTTSDYCVGQVFGRRGADSFLLDQKRARIDFPATLEAVRALTVKWPAASAKLVEDKANGTAVIATLKHEIPGLIEVNPEGGKQARAAAVSPQIEAGNVFLPHPSLYPWVPDYIAEWGMFPKGAHDDMVDATSQALLRWKTGAVPNIRLINRADSGKPYENIAATFERLRAMRMGWRG